MTLAGMLEFGTMSELIENKALSEREIEVLRLLAAGLSNKEIARQLVLSVNTVKVHLRNIFAKLDVQSRTEATLVAIQRGWVSVPQGQPAEAMLYTPAGLPRIVVEPPLSMWRRAMLIAVALVCALAVVATGLRPANGVAAANDEFSERPAGANPVNPAPGDSPWSMAASMPTARTRLAVAAYGGRLVAIGGDTQNGATDAVEWFNPKTGEWSTGAPKPVPVSNVSAVVLGDRVVVPGGMTSAGAPTTTVEVYDPPTNTWSPAAPLPEPRMAYAAAAFEDELFLFGGGDGSAYSSHVYVYDAAADDWDTRAPMSVPRGFASAAALGNAIYVVGGFDGQIESSLCERYLPREDRWEACPPMSIGRGGLTLVAIGNNLYAIGGGWSGYLAFNESYTVGSDAWRAIPTPFTGQWRGLGAAVIDAEILAVGGWNGQYLAVTERYSPFPFRIFVPAAQGESQP